MDNEDNRPSRRAILGVFAGLCAVAAAPVYARVPGFLRGAGDLRRVRMYSQRTGEAVDTIYFANGRYIPEAMTEISYFMRDWRHNQVMKYDPRNVDILAATLRMMDTDEPYLLISGYRTPQTNRMLRGAARGLAAHARHGRRRAAEEPLGEADLGRRLRLQRRRGRHLRPLELRAHGLRPGAQLARLRLGH